MSFSLQQSKLFADLSSQVEIREHEAALLFQRLASSQHGQLTSRLHELQERLQRDDAGMHAANEAMAAARDRVAQLEAEMRDVEGARRRKLKVSDDGNLGVVALCPLCLLSCFHHALASSPAHPLVCRD